MARARVPLRTMVTAANGGSPQSDGRMLAPLSGTTLRFATTRGLRVRRIPCAWRRGQRGYRCAGPLGIRPTCVGLVLKIRIIRNKALSPLYEIVRNRPEVLGWISLDEWPRQPNRCILELIVQILQEYVRLAISRAVQELVLARRLTVQTVEPQHGIRAPSVDPLQHLRWIGEDVQSLCGLRRVLSRTGQKERHIG